MSAARKLAQKKVRVLELGGLAPEAVDGGCIGVTENESPEQVLAYATDRQIHHICQKQGFAFDKEMQSSSVLIKNPEAFRRFPVASVLTPTDLSALSERALIEVDENFSSSAAKPGIIRRINDAMESKGLAQTLIEDVVTVADEMFTNAVYNAPFVDPLSQTNPGISRHHTEVKFENGRQARVFLAHDESRLLIGCEDPFGSLNLHSYLTKIRNTYVMGPAAAMNFGRGGAGLGSYMIFNAGSSLYFGVWPGSATIVCCVIPLGISYRKRVQLPKHLHWIQF